MSQETQLSPDRKKGNFDLRAKLQRPQVKILGKLRDKTLEGPMHL